jgi:hypothetical protein
LGRRLKGSSLWTPGRTTKVRIPKEAKYQKETSCNKKRHLEEI